MVSVEPFFFAVEIGVIAYLLNPSDPISEIEGKGVLSAARTLRIELRLLNASSESELDTAIASVGGLGAGALIVSGEPFFRQPT